MNVQEEKKIYGEAEKYVDIQQNLRNGIQFSLFVEFQSENL